MPKIIIKTKFLWIEYNPENNKIICVFLNNLNNKLFNQITIKVVLLTVNINKHFKEEAQQNKQTKNNN